jgi:putative oxidoreductase
MLNGIIPASWSGHLHAALRIMTGLLFMQHGTMKILGFPMNDMMKGMLAQMPGGMTMFTGGLELIGGLLIAIGLFTRPVAFVLSGFMAAAYFIAHAPQGFFPILNMGELAIMFSFVFLWLAAAGAGPFSVDASRSRV